MIHAVIMAGGKGTRFWPMSRASKPKQFLKIFGNRTLLDHTILRLSPLIPSENVLIVGNKTHGKFLVSTQKRFKGSQVLYEPCGRNTAACIGWAAIELLKKDPEAVMVVLPADHYIEPASAFRQVIKQATQIAQQEDRLVTIGIHPVFAHTGYGYIETAASHLPIKTVKSFCEKPDEKTAEKYLKTGRYYWNSGIFIWKASKILSLFETHLPAHFNLLKKIQKLETCDSEAFSQIFEQFENISIDYGIMEKVAQEIKMIPATFMWNDIGNWTSLETFWEKDEKKNAHLGNLVAVNSDHNLVYSEKRLVTLIDVNNLIVIDSEDALLILPKTSDQKIRQLYDQLPPSFQ